MEDQKDNKIPAASNAPPALAARCTPLERPTRILVLLPCHSSVQRPAPNLCLAARLEQPLFDFGRHRHAQCRRGLVGAPSPVADGRAEDRSLASDGYWVSAYYLGGPWAWELLSKLQCEGCSGSGVLWQWMRASVCGV